MKYAIVRESAHLVKGYTEPRDAESLQTANLILRWRREEARANIICIGESGIILSRDVCMQRPV